MADIGVSAAATLLLFCRAVNGGEVTPDALRHLLAEHLAKILVLLKSLWLFQKTTVPMSFDGWSKWVRQDHNAGKLAASFQKSGKSVTLAAMIPSGQLR